MSFDIFLQRFDGGPVGKPNCVEDLIGALVVDRRDAWMRVATADGEADVYGDDPEDHFMINHASGRAVWDLMYEIAAVGRFVVLVGHCGTCVPDDGVRRSLPPEVPQPVTTVHSGADLLAVVESM